MRLRQKVIALITTGALMFSTVTCIGYSGVAMAPDFDADEFDLVPTTLSNLEVSGPRFTDIDVHVETTPITTAVSTTCTITTTTTVTTTTIATTEPVTEPTELEIEYEEIEQDFYEESVSDDCDCENSTDDDEECVEEYTESNGDGYYAGSFKATWYTAVDMGYTYVPGGLDGTGLVSGYSIASSALPAGSLVQIVGGGIDGIYHVNDYCPSGGSIIDFYYWDRSYIPEHFRIDGTYTVEAYVLD